MDQASNKRFGDTNREKPKKKNVQEKKTKSDITTITSGSSMTDPSLESFFVLGKACSYTKSRSNESSYRLHECYSETTINPFSESVQNFKDVIQGEGLQQVASNSSFISAQSDLSSANQKQMLELEDKLVKQDLEVQCLKRQLGQELVEFSSVGTETDESICDVNKDKSKLKDLEKKIVNKEKKIKELNQKLEECSKVSNVILQENKSLSHKVSFLSRQLQSMFELLASQKWNSVDLTELAISKNKATELEAVVASLDEEKSKLTKKIETISFDLERKEKELASKTRELVEYKNKSTLEMCKLINQIDCLQKDAKTQSELLDFRILEVQTSMEEEIITITQKLEAQYQKDVESAIEKFHKDFEKLGNLPKTAIEHLLKFCEPDKIDFISYQKEWNSQQQLLEEKIVNLQLDHNKEITQIKDTYDSKIIFLKTQIEALTSQLKERKKIIDIFENELMVYKSNSSMNLLKASTLGDDIFALKELYNAELFSQKQVHELQVNVFEEKVKTLTDEILYHARNEEIQVQELENAKKMALAFRGKYEQLVFEWGEKVEKDFKLLPDEPDPTPELDAAIAEFKNLMESLRKSERTHEERIKLLESKNDNEKLSLLQELENFKMKLRNLKQFQETQTKLDDTIQQLIQSVGTNYTKTVESLLLNHVTEVSLKQMEICALEKRHIKEIDELKNDHEKEVAALQQLIQRLETGKKMTESELASLRKIIKPGEVEALNRKIEELTTEFIKSEGLIAIKEETEKALNDRIEELENLLRVKEENCRKELEDLTAKYIKAEVLSSTKDDLAKELEDKLNQSETLLEKSCKNIDRLTEICLSVESETCHGNDRGDAEAPERLEEAKEIGDRLRVKLIGMFEKIEEAKEKENEIIHENIKLKNEISILEEEVKRNEKILSERKKEEPKEVSELKNKLQVLEAEKNVILERENLIEEEKMKISERNKFLEKNVNELNERVEALLMEITDNKHSEEPELFSFTLQEVRFLYEEESLMETKPPTSTIGCQVQLPDTQGNLLETLKKENERLLNERVELTTVLECLENERDCLKEELENVWKENKVVSQKKKYSDHVGMSEMNAEIGKLNDYIKTLSKKLEVMKASNELLLNESQDRMKQNQNLVTELEEAWNQRYEIEDQLTTVRKQNALLNLHRRRLEETNRKISNLVAEGKPSIVSWIRIHETVENIVDEVFALKTSVSDSGSLSGASLGLDLPGTNSDLKLMTEMLHAQLKNKTALCNELILQKETLERELKNLESFLQDSGSRQQSRRPRSSGNGRKRQFELQNRKPAHCSSEKRQALDGNPKNSHLQTLNRLKKQLEDEAELEEAQFRESLEHEIQELKKEVREPEESSVELKAPSGNGGECLKSIEAKYEKEVVALTEEFEKQVQKLKKMFSSEKDDPEVKKNYEEEIEKLKNYFEKKWEDLEKRYTEIIQKQKKQSTHNPKLARILEQFHTILQEDEEAEKATKLENFLIDIINRHDHEVNSLQQKNKEAVEILQTQHESEAKKLQAVVFQLKENMLTALRKEVGGREEEYKKVIPTGSFHPEYEARLEEEKKRLCDLLEDARQKHEREILALEEFWTEKLSECETKCALMRATGRRKAKSREESENSRESLEIEENRMNQALSEGAEERRVVKYGEILDFEPENYKSEFTVDGTHPRDSFCVSRLPNRSLYKRMELKTDDDKLDVIQQRDATLEEMISSMRGIIAKLLTFIGQYKPELNNTTLDIDDTLYKSIHFDLDKTASDVSVASNSVLMVMDLSAIFQEIKDNSLLNSSDQVRYELEKCLKQLKKDETCLLALSCSENTASQNLGELMRKVEKEKNDLEAKVLKVEEMQKEMKKEINTTKERLSQWERNLEVVSEGYGEEIVEPKQVISLTVVKEKLQAFLTENYGHSTQDINLLEEICKEGDLLKEQWLKEKCDLQQQIEAADKQLHSLKKFLEEQALEREQEREAFDKEIIRLQENLKAKERDNSLQNRTNREVEALVGQVKELTVRLTEMEKNKEAVEGEFQNAVKKIWSLREVIQDLEVQLAQVSEREINLKKKFEKLDGLVEEQSKVNRSLKEELDVCRNQNELKYSEHTKTLEDELNRLRHVVDQVNPESLTHLKANLKQIEAILIKKTKDLEQLHISSANVSCSSPSEDVSIRDHLDASRCSTPDEMLSGVQPLSVDLPLEEIDRVHDRLARHTRAEEVAMKYIQDLKMQLRNHRKMFEEVQTERDVLLEKVDAYLKENSSLKVRLEEQRCNAGLLQKQLNANLESQISRLEVDVEKLNGMCNEKDKQLKELKVILENTTKSLKVREAEALNKSKEENVLITTLRTDLANALNEKEKLEEKLEKTREKLRETLRMPALIDSMIDEKNAEIDRLEKEVARLSSEKTSGITSRSYSSEEKQKKKIRFSEPDSFSENISSISLQCSDMRNCSDSIGYFRNSSFKSRWPVGSSPKLESISSIAPLQLSPRGTDSSFNWKPSSPMVGSESVIGSLSKSPSKSSKSPTEPDFQQMEEISKLQREVESKLREISELHLEIDILKRKLVEVNQEVATAKSESKEVQNDLATKEEEINKSRETEKNLLKTIDTIKKNHAEEVEELQKKLTFEHGKVEKVYEEIKALEVKKIEIEEAFLSVKEDYNEKLNGERKTAEALLQRIRALEVKNGESELKMGALEKKLGNTVKESEDTIQTLSKEISDLKIENEKIRSVSRRNAETQVEGEVCVCQNSLNLEMPKGVEPLKENLNELKSQFDKMAAVIGERNFNKREALLYAVAVRKLLSVVLRKVEELSKEVDTHMKKVMECSVDDLAVKVQKELVLSAKLDNELLSSIEANGLVSKEATPQPDFLDLIENPYGDIGGVGSDGKLMAPKPLGNVALTKVAGLYKDITNKMMGLTKEQEKLEGKISEQQQIIRLLEESLKKEKERILEEKDRCSEDAKIMELLRVNLEKRLHDIRTKEKELKKEKLARMALEAEIEKYKKQGGNCWESKKIGELKSALENQKEKLLSLNQLLEEEKKKNQELKLSVEEGKLERMSEKNALRLVEDDLGMLREQKDNLKMELLKARKLLHSRNVEIGLLKRKINLQEIDIKALSLSNNLQNPSETSSITSNPDLGFNGEPPTSLLFKMKRLNSCVQRRVRESTEMGETLLYLSQETEQMRDIIRKLEENNETKLSDETLLPEAEIERKLWALEKGRLVMEVETLKKENGVLKHDLVDTCKSNEALKQENSKLLKERSSSQKKENVTNLVENGFLQERVSHLTSKYLRTESYRKALAWQKHYLVITLQEYQRSEEEAWRKLGRRKKDGKKKPKPCGRFRVVALAAVAIFRMRFIFKRWRKHTLNHVLSLMDNQPNKLKLAPLASVLNIYTDPVDPLAYQTQNIFRQSSSQVLRTPPSRDPGPQNFNVDRLETIDSRH